MKRTTKIVLFMSLISLGFGCSNTTTKASSGVDKIKESKFHNDYPEFSSWDLSTRFQGKIKDDKLLYPFYSSTNYNLIWVKDTLDTSKLGELIFILSNVERHGLSKQLFPSEKIITIAKAIEAGLYADNVDTLYDELIELEKLASTSAIKYAVGMRFGFLNPKELYGGDYAITVDKATEEYYNELYSNLDKGAIDALLASQPSDSAYLLLQAEFQKLDFLKNMRIPRVPYKGKSSYKLLDRGEDVAAIAKRLALTGEYTYPDSIGINPEGYILDSDVLEAVNEFRRRNSYFEEKEIGAATVEALNRPLTYYQDKAKANLERYRWRRSKEKHSKHIEVNVASQLLIATDNGKRAIEMRVAVGSLKNKTPLLQSDLSYINLNPIWNVPTSIARKELSVKQKNNRGYLKRNNMKLYKSGQEVDIESVDWDNIDPETFGYSIKQSAGSANALGKLKFMFNNNFAVYLHDTPSKAAFSRRNRAVSHGCIRLQHPIDLALFCTNPNDATYTDRLYHTIDLKAPSAEGKKLQAEKKLAKIDDIIRMKEGISIFIDYATAYVKPEDKTIYYADDVYDYDKPILDGLEKLAKDASGQQSKTILVNTKKGG